MSRSKNVARVTRSELLGMSGKELKKLLPAGDQYKPTDKMDLCDYLIESGAVDLVVEKPSLIQSGVEDLGGDLVPSVDQSPSVVQSNSVDQSHLVDQLPSADQSPPPVVAFVEVNQSSPVVAFVEVDQYSPVVAFVEVDQSSSVVAFAEEVITEGEERISKIIDRLDSISLEANVLSSELQDLLSKGDQQTRPLEQRTPVKSVETSAQPAQRISTQQPQPVKSVESSAQREQEETKKELARLRAEVAKRIEAGTKLEKERDELKEANNRLSCSYDDLMLQSEQRATQNIWELARLRAEVAKWTEAHAKLGKERDALEESNKRLSRSYDVLMLQVEQRATQTIPAQQPQLYASAIESDYCAHVFRIGDRAVITNDYKCQQGTTGTVTSVWEDWVTIRDNCGYYYKRKCYNMRKIPRR